MPLLKLFLWILLLAFAHFVFLICDILQMFLSPTICVCVAVWYYMVNLWLKHHALCKWQPLVAVVSILSPKLIHLLMVFFFLVRGYVTGSTDTSLWTVYKKGVRNYCGNVLTDGATCYYCHFHLLCNFWFLWFFNECITGMVKNEKLPENILTPTTKAADHDVPVTPDEVFIY